ncbi:hypothetical protein [Achromobacter xylosoxidans]|uniref:hypothetical protein n=1 Tax=Alcaligenes xylosoxydans xylosoxydans TaxID=85698 RepID=UPI0022B8CB1B|nr:hypothetical protein [Achromobacter xylosoxidans]MCZ8437130.1 hypothetical protein [Achromobacter xylosoxidans]
MSKKNKESKPTKTLGDCLKLIQDVKRSGSINRIYDLINSIEKFDQRSSLIPSKFHAPASLYAAPLFPNRNLLGELAWGSVVLQRSCEDIENYLRLKQEIEILIVQSRWEEALASLTNFELEHGTASCIKELSIAITQQAEGTAKQVAYSRKLESKCKAGAFIYLVRFSSERNEDRLTLSGFRRNLREHFSGEKVPPLASAVIHWHGMHQLPDEEGLLSELLGFEGTGSIFDYYELFVAVAVHLATRADSKTRAALKNCLQRLSKISDRRLLNLRKMLAGQFSPSLTAITAINILSEIRSRSRPGHDLTALEKSIFDFLAENSPDSGARRHIHKLSANFYYLDFFQAAFCQLEHKASTSSLDQAVSPGLSVLSAETSIRSVFSCAFEIAQDIFSSMSFRLEEGVKEGSAAPQDENADALLFKAIGLAKKGMVDELIMMARECQFHGLERAQMQIITIGACIEAARYVDILPFALQVSEFRLDSLSLVPIVRALESVFPGRLDGRDAVIFSIVTSKVLLVEDSDRLEDKLMVATEVAFSNRKLTPLWATADPFSRQLWVRFLCDVMTVQNMLLIDEIDSLRDALNLRVEVLRMLVDLDPDERDKYHEEVRDITFELSVDEGIRQVNTSRLNVNINGLTKWANDHCADDYERYKELIVGEASAGRMPTKITGGAGTIFDQFAAIPIEAADDQLIKLLARIRNAYLSDPRNGLDAFISLRVRHGSLSGTLSRGLDTRQLLLLRRGDGGPFEPPLYWIERLNVAGEKVTEVTKAFAIFTADFQKSIDALLKNRLRVKNDRNPQGEITAEITDIFVKSLKIDIVQGLSFETFISTVFITYKNAVSAYLESVREYLKSKFLNDAIEAFQLLSRSVGQIVGDDKNKGYLDDAITNARLDLQTSVRVVCDWLEIAQKEDLAQLYTLQQAIKIGINYTRQVRNDFSPEIVVKGVDESFRVTGGSLIVIVDILFILLDNVYKHAGLPNERIISLTFDLSEDGFIRIRMKNDLSSGTDRNEVITQFDGARRLIAGSEGERKLTEEDRSGLPKLSRLVVQDRSDALTFGLMNDEVEVNVLIGYSSLELAQ